MLGSLRFLLEAVQDVQRFLKLGDIDYPECATQFPDADFTGAGTDLIKRLPVLRLQASLHLT